MKCFLVWNKKQLTVPKYNQQPFKMNSRNNNMKTMTFCKVCKDSGKPESMYTSHYVKDQSGPNGVVVCPTLLSQQCGYCHKLGHTPTHCPILASIRLEEKRVHQNKTPNKTSYKLNEKSIPMPPKNPPNRPPPPPTTRQVPQPKWFLTPTRPPPQMVPPPPPPQMVPPPPPPPQQDEIIVANLLETVVVVVTDQEKNKLKKKKKTLYVDPNPE